MIFNFSYEKKVKSLFHKQHRNIVRNILSSSFAEFKKSQFSSNTADNFNELMINCFYDENDLLQEVEIFEPNVVYVLEDNNFMGKDDADIKKNIIGIRYYI
ncbi:hypothetical protein BKK51_09400 [Rodentibacter trehalosifermentans]|uniref:Uncharacterized protein n=1 Tax=Rodentibacter trehalosifermentans TaxID=1908263 RepID=A0A1V3IPM6_9PAST|nr:hypothetical protein BKK51_09400 [Rodentibacter trehalosifermentans]OOF49241.1 hypothetical protein BKK52_04175 [Rodentibacter trehalosifermentans]